MGQTLGHKCFVYTVSFNNHKNSDRTSVLRAQSCSARKCLSRYSSKGSVTAGLGSQRRTERQWAQPWRVRTSSCHSGAPPGQIPAPGHQREQVHPAQHRAVSAEWQARSLYLCRRFPRGASGRRDPSGPGAGPGSLEDGGEEASPQTAANTTSRPAPCIAPLNPDATGEREQKCSPMRCGEKGRWRPRQGKSRRALWRLAGRRSPSRLGLRCRRESSPHAWRSPDPPS